MKKVGDKTNRKLIGVMLVLSGASLYIVMNLLSSHFIIKDFIRGFIEGFSLSIAIIGFIAVIVVSILQKRNRAKVYSSK